VKAIREIDYLIVQLWNEISFSHDERVTDGDLSLLVELAKHPAIQNVLEEAKDRVRVRFEEARKRNENEV